MFHSQLRPAYDCSYAGVLGGKTSQFNRTRPALQHRAQWGVISAKQKQGVCFAERFFQSAAVEDGTYGKALGITPPDEMVVIDG